MGCRVYRVSPNRAPLEDPELCGGVETDDGAPAKQNWNLDGPSTQIIVL